MTNETNTTAEYPPLPDFDAVEQHVYGACRRFVSQDMLGPIHNLMSDYVDVDRAMRAQAVPEGWRLVPVEPTLDMTRTARVNMEYRSCTPAQIWAAMLSAAPSAPAKPTVEEAHEMGAKGAPATEAERLLFEAWMHGHCWALCAHWDGKQYVADDETNGYVNMHALATRRLWAAWRDRAALAQANESKT